MIRFILAVICLLMYVGVHAQNTFHPYVHNYELPQEYKYLRINNIASLKDQTMIFATQKGLLSYDGSEWQMLVIPEQPKKLHYDEYSGLLFVGCDKTFGIISKKTDGTITFQALEDSASAEPVLSIHSTGQHVYFLRSSEVICWDTKENRVLRSWKSEHYHYEGMFVFKDKAYVTIEQKGVYELQDRGIKSVFVGKFGGVAFAYPSGNELVVSDNNGKILRFDGNTMWHSDIDARSYILSNRISCGIPINGETCAVGTKNAGIAFIDSKTGTILRMSNYQTGLADDEVRCLYLDSNNGLWIGHGEGISRADMQLGITDFSIYPGLIGTVQTALVYDNILYVGTSDGVYFLNSVNNYSEIKAFIRHSESYTGLQKVTAMRKVNKIVRVSFQDKSGKGSITKDIPVEIEIPVDSVISTGTDKFVSDTVRKQYGIKSFPLHFKKIPGISAKCMHLCAADNAILVGTNNGLFKIENKTGIKLMEQVSVSYIQPSAENNYFAISNAGLLSFTLAPSFEIIGMNDKLNNLSSLDYADNILWMTTGNKLKKIQVSKGRHLGAEESFSLPDYFTEDNIISVLNSKPTVFTYSDAYTYSVENSQIEQSALLSEYLSIRQRPLAKQMAYFWAKGDGQWTNLKSSESTPQQTLLFNIFNHIDDIHKDIKNNYWIVGDSRLYKIHGELPQRDSTKGVSINSIISKTPFAIKGNTLTLDSKNQGLEIRYSSKYYIGENKAQYRFRLRGLNDEWTDWTNLSTIKYPFIPGGSYIFELECKNIFGQRFVAEPLRLEVHIPMWEKWWFLLSSGLLIIGALVFVFSSRTIVAGMQEIE